MTLVTKTHCWNNTEHFNIKSGCFTHVSSVYKEKWVVVIEVHVQYWLRMPFTILHSR